MSEMHSVEKDAGQVPFDQAVDEHAERARKFWQDALNRYAERVTSPERTDP